jgi:hypothetical protein
MRARHPGRGGHLRPFLTALLLVAVAAASVLEGEGADLVAGDDGDAQAVRRPENALTVHASPRPRDVTGAPVRAPFLAAVDSAPAVQLPNADRAGAFPRSDSDRLADSPPLPSRAPPAV